MENDITVGIDYTLLKEMQHRMKNNLQLILSLINIQISKDIQKTNIDFLQSLNQRIQSLSLINNLLNHSFNETEINLGILVSNISDSVFEAYKTREDIILLKHIENIKVDNFLAIPMGLILNELLTNSFKYAFPEISHATEKKYCKIEVILRKNNNMIELIVSDNGISVNNEDGLKKTKSSGVKLVKSLVEQIGGKCQIDCNNGVTFKITF